MTTDTIESLRAELADARQALAMARELAARARAEALREAEEVARKHRPPGSSPLSPERWNAAHETAVSIEEAIRALLAAAPPEEPVRAPAPSIPGCGHVVDGRPCSMPAAVSLCDDHAPGRTYEQGWAEAMKVVDEYIAGESEGYDSYARVQRKLGKAMDSRDYFVDVAGEFRALGRRIRALSPPAPPPAPTGEVRVCGKRCDHGSECLRQPHDDDRHETQHGCVFYGPAPTEEAAKCGITPESCAAHGEPYCDCDK